MRFLERERHGYGLHSLMGHTCNGERKKEHQDSTNILFPTIAVFNTLNPRTIEYYNKQQDTVLKSYGVHKQHSHIIESSETVVVPNGRG